MPHNRTRDWRRKQARQHISKNKQAPTYTRWLPKDWKHLHLRSAKLHRARQIGKIWPSKEWIALMQDASPINILFVCSKNQWRSPTGETIFAKVQGVSSRSAGTSNSARHKITVKDIRWADLILVMEQKHCSRIKADFRDETRYKQLHILDIPDDYYYMDAELVDIIKTKTEDILKEQKL